MHWPSIKSVIHSEKHFSIAVTMACESLKTMAMLLFRDG